MKLTLPDGHTVNLTPWLLRAVRGAFPLPDDEGRLAPFVPDWSVGEVLIREGVAAHDGGGVFALTEHGVGLHRMATAPEDGVRGGGGRLTYSSELTTEELAEARTAEERLREGARAFRWGEPLPAPVRYGVVAGMGLLALIPLAADWYLGWPGFLLPLVLLVLMGEGVLMGRVNRFGARGRTAPPARSCGGTRGAASPLPRSTRSPVNSWSGFSGRSTPPRTRRRWPLRSGSWPGNWRGAASVGRRSKGCRTPTTGWRV